MYPRVSVPRTVIDLQGAVTCRLFDRGCQEPYAAIDIHGGEQSGGVTLRFADHASVDAVRAACERLADGWVELP